MILDKTTDPRRPLDKATRHELGEFARAAGLHDYNPETPSILGRDIIRARNLEGQFTAWARDNTPERVLGQPARPPEMKWDSAVTPAAAQADATNDLARQWAAQQQARPAPPPAPDARALKDMSINELRARGKALGIKFDRKDNMPVMRQKIEAAENVPNAS